MSVVDRLPSTLALALLLGGTSAIAQGGSFRKEKVDAFYAGREANYAADDEKCIAETECNAVVLTGSMPFTFSSMDFKGGAVTLGAKLQLGAAVALVIGKGTRSGTGVLTVNPIFTIGLSLLGGATSSANAVGGSFGAGGFVALGPLGIIGGYDFVQQSAFIGLSAKIDSFVVTDALSMILSLKRVP